MKQKRTGLKWGLTVLLIAVLASNGGSISASAELLPRDYTIDAKAGPGGSIDPEGRVKVKPLLSQTFIITPDPGFEILDVVVDDRSQGPLSEYTFTFVRRNHKITATFIAKKYSLKASSGEGGSISPTGEVMVEHGKDQRFEIVHETDFEIADVFVDGLSMGPIADYTFTNVQADHSISAAFKRSLGVMYLSVPDLGMKVGDEVPVILTVSDDEGLAHMLVSGEVGGYSLRGFERITSTSYQSTFTVVEGGNSYIAQDDIPVSNLVISNGDILSLPYSSMIVQDNDPLDASTPQILNMEVPSVVASVGDTVKLTINADEDGYTALGESSINGLPLDIDRVTLADLSDGVYQMSYLVGEADNDVAPGMLEASVVLTDAAGNIGSTFQAIDPNSLEIYTDLPEAGIEDIPTICRGEEAVLKVLLTGRAPWSIDLHDGITTTTYDNIASQEYNIFVAPLQTSVFEISAVRDVNGKENTDNGSVLITVDQAADVEIINLVSIHNVSAEPIALEANVPGGVFSGPGVISATGTFYPSVADTLNSPHTIRYTYANENGCISLDSQLVHVVGSESAIIIPGSALCLNAEPFDAIVSNIPGTTGAFTLLNEALQHEPGLTDHGDNTASIDPDLLEAGSYTIEFMYIDVITRYLRKEFIIEFPGVPIILDMEDASFCQNEAPFALRSDIADVVFEGPGVSGNVEEGFTFNPSETEHGHISITCTAFSEHGCWASSEEEVVIGYTPEALFAVSTACLPDEGEMASFENQVLEPSLVETWEWDFGDVESGENNYSSQANPKHLYLEPGPKVISLIATSYAGCVDTLAMEAIIDGRPEVDFTWISDCLSPESGVKFVNRSYQETAVVDTVIWTFKSAAGDILGEIGSGSATDTVAFPFASADTFLVDLYVMNSGGCSEKLSRELILRPRLTLDPVPYAENFDESEGMWSSFAEDSLTSWVWGVPDFSGFVSSENDKAWFTRLPDREEDYVEHSWIQSPCYDLSGMDRPMISMDIMRSFVPYLEGAVLQYREVLEEGWHTLGDQTPGIEWYNMDYLVDKPGGSDRGWGADKFEPDTEWVRAIHDLDQLEGKADVSLRIAIVSEGQLEAGNQGFALNNVEIAERTKFAVLEHFTNSSDDSSRLADSIVDALAAAHQEELIDLQYHLSYPGFDWMNRNNPGPASTRSLNYGVSQVPYSILDGGHPSDMRYALPDLGAGSLAEDVILNSLGTPEFAVEMIANWTDDELQVSTTSTCLAEGYDENIQLYVVVFEKSVTAYTGENGDAEFRNVVLDILPTPGGTLLGNNWSEGKNETRTFTWEYPSYVEDVEDLAIAAFVQDRGNWRILQAAVEHKNELVGVNGRELSIRSLEIYPNPAGNFSYVNFGEPGDGETLLELLDMSGKLVLSEHVPAGYQVVRLEIGHLSDGLYLLRRIESGQLTGVSKLVKMR